MFVVVAQQFFKNEFPSRHACTTRRNVYRSCLVCDTCVRELMVLDVPPQVRILHVCRSMLTKKKNKDSTASEFVHVYVVTMCATIIKSFNSISVCGWLCVCVCLNLLPFVRSPVQPSNRPSTFGVRMRRAEKVSGRQFGRMEQRTSARPAHCARLCAGLRYGQFGDVPGTQHEQQM